MMPLSFKTHMVSSENLRQPTVKRRSIAASFSRVTLAFLLLSAVGIGSLDLQAQAQEAGGPRDGTVDPVLAVVNGVPVRRSEVLDATKDLSPEFKQLPLEMVYPVLIDRMIDIRLLAAKGRETGLENDKEVKQKVYEKTQEIMQEVYLNRYVSQKITESGLRDRYNRYVSDNSAREVAHVYHILVGNEALAKDLIKKLEAGANFTELAQQHSLGPDRVKGGNLGFVGKGDMTPEFVTAVLNIKAGQLAKVPVKSEFGWHVVKVTDRKTLPAPSFEEMRDRLVKEWSGELISSHVKDLRSQANIERFDYKEGRLDK